MKTSLKHGNAIARRLYNVVRKGEPQLVPAVQAIVKETFTNGKLVLEEKQSVLFVQSDTAGLADVGFLLTGEVFEPIGLSIDKKTIGKYFEIKGQGKVKQWK